MLNQILSKLNIFNCQASIDSEINARTNNGQKEGEESENNKQTSLVHDSFKFMDEAVFDLTSVFNRCPGLVFEKFTNELSIRLIEPGQEEFNNSFLNKDLIILDEYMESIKNLQVTIKPVEGYKYSVSIVAKDEESITQLKNLIGVRGKWFKLCVLFFAPKHELLKKNVIDIICELEKKFEGFNEILEVFSNDIRNKIKDFKQIEKELKSNKKKLKKELDQLLRLNINKVKNIECISKDIKKKLKDYFKYTVNFFLDYNLGKLDDNARKAHIEQGGQILTALVVGTCQFILKEIQRMCSENKKITFPKDFLEVFFKNKIVGFVMFGNNFLKILFLYMKHIMPEASSPLKAETKVFRFNKETDMFEEVENKSIMSQELTKEDKIDPGVKDNPNISGSDPTSQTGSALNEKETTSSIVLTEGGSSSAEYKKIKVKQTQEQQVTFPVNSLKQEESFNKKDILQGGGMSQSEEIVKGDEITHGAKTTKKNKKTHGEKKTKKGRKTHGEKKIKRDKITHGAKITKNDKTTQGEEITKKNKITHEEEIIKNDRITQGGEITEEESITQGEGITKKNKITHGDEITKKNGITRGERIAKNDRITQGGRITKEGGITQGEEITKEDGIAQTVEQTKTHFYKDQRNTKKWLVMPISIGLIIIFILVYLFLVSKKIVYEVEE
ncbi:hypothetical protein CDIK_0718 [Cucumispora dikerogammari]|nr:hypothetical protein CDIK_0718 [Cucumispora dikerogammari]